VDQKSLALVFMNDIRVGDVVILGYGLSIRAGKVEAFQCVHFVTVMVHGHIEWVRIDSLRERGPWTWEQVT
jgi:hypothetical protein